MRDILKNKRIPKAKQIQNVELSISADSESFDASNKSTDSFLNCEGIVFALECVQQADTGFVVGSPTSSEDAPLNGRKINDLLSID